MGAVAVSATLPLHVAIPCGDVAGLVHAIATALPGTTAGLNSDHVAGCTYGLASAYPGTADGLPPIDRPLTLEGNGSIITRTGSSFYRILETTASGVVTATDLSITNGHVQAVGGAFAGGILNAGVLRLTRGTVSGNVADAPASSFQPANYGGGIVTTGTLVLDAVHVDANVNGGIVNLTGGAATLLNSTVNGNSGGAYSGIGFENGRGDPAADGELAPGGTVELMNTSVNGNASAGILVRTGSLALIGGTASHNGGRGIDNSTGDVTVTGSTIEGNAASWGAGLCNCGPGAITVTDSKVVENSANAFSPDGGVTIIGGFGGGICNCTFNPDGNPPGVLTLARTLVAGNSASVSGGGIDNNGGALTLVDSMIEGNSSGGSGNGFGGFGGGIRNVNGGVATIDGGSISNNSVVEDPFTGGGEGGGIWNAGSLTVTGTVLRGNQAPGGGCGECSPGLGGGLDNASGGTAVLAGVRVIGNVSGSGGGIYNEGTAIAIADVFSGNTPDNCAPHGSVVGCKG